jgi:L-ascorbate metabolism protein UlaG (beta-lactamase superfamily)
VVTINGIKFFHTGDIDNLQDIVPYNLADQHIDFAFIQHFYLRNGGSRNMLNNDIGAKYLIPIHYQFTEPAFDINVILSNYPDAIVFYGELESWFMPSPEN